MLDKRFNMDYLKAACDLITFDNSENAITTW